MKIPGHRPDQKSVSLQSILHQLLDLFSSMALGDLLHPCQINYMTHGTRPWGHMRLGKQSTTVESMEYLMADCANTSSMVGHPLHRDLDSPLCFEEEKQYYPNQLPSRWHYMEVEHEHSFSSKHLPWKHIQTYLGAQVMSIQWLGAAESTGVVKLPRGVRLRSNLSDTNLSYMDHYALF